MSVPTRIEKAARQRIEANGDQIRRSIQMIRAGTPLAAEPEKDRLLRRLVAKGRRSGDGVGALALGVRSVAGERAEEVLETVVKMAGPERIYGGTVDFVGVAFLARGVRAARGVGRVASADNQAIGSGFLISNRLFLTNNHVIGSAEEAREFVVEFDYEYDLDGRLREFTRFTLAPNKFFLTSEQDDLDYTIVALGERHSGPGSLPDFGCCSLSGARDKHALGEVANIVQHPAGRYKEVVLRENRLVSRMNTVLHYVADTEPGSSGSPVFNNEWQVIALHHWGGPWREQVDDQGRPLPTEVNEGIRASAIVAHLLEQRPTLDSPMAELLDAALRLGERAGGAPTMRREDRAAQGGEPRIDPDGKVTWSIPVEVSIRLPKAALVTLDLPEPGTDGSRGKALSERKREVEPDYDLRPGYQSDFIPGFDIAAPKLSAEQRKKAAKVAEGDAELRYNHFSVVMNKERKLAFYTACNIDGVNAKDIDRKTGKVVPRKPLEERYEGGAEATERWFQDPRLAEGLTTSDAFYSKQNIPGYPDKQTKAWQNRMFQRGHLVRRVDPVWGSDREAVGAEADTFHHTNCSPQVGFFNMGTADPRLPGTGGGKLWRAIEDYVLENAVSERKRVCVFTGPVLDANDIPWREQRLPGFAIPMRFWKVVVWAADSQLRTVAMIADQSRVIKVMSESLEGAERYTETDSVRDFLTSVVGIERLTGLTFDDQVRAADLNPDLGEGLGERYERVGLVGMIPVSRFEDIRLGPTKKVG